MRTHPYTLTFDKTFTTGSLAGLTIRESIGVLSEASAKRMMAGWTANSQRNGYSVSNPTVTRNY